MYVLVANRWELRANLPAAVAVVAGSGAALLCARWFGFSVSATGMFAGSLTGTASLQTAISVSGSDMPAVAYAIAYPFGVFGRSCCFFLTHKLLQKVEAVGNQHLMAGEIDVDQAGLAGLTIGQVQQRRGPKWQCCAVTAATVSWSATRAQAGDTLLVAGQPAAIGSLKLAPDLGDIRADRHDFDLVLAYVSRETLVGQRLDRLPLPQDIAHRIVQVRRGDVDLVPTADLVLEVRRPGRRAGGARTPGQIHRNLRRFGQCRRRSSRSCPSAWAWPPAACLAWCRSRSPAWAR